MPKLVVMPPLDELKRSFAGRLAAELSQYRVVAPETEEEARRELGDADAAYGWIPPDLLPLAGKLQWLQNPDAGPRPGYFYPALEDHPVVVCNPRGIYNDHISQHIMMFLLALARGHSGAGELAAFALAHGAADAFSATAGEPVGRVTRQATAFLDRRLDVLRALAVVQ